MFPVGCDTKKPQTLAGLGLGFFGCGRAAQPLLLCVDKYIKPLFNKKFCLKTLFLLVSDLHFLQIGVLRIRIQVIKRGSCLLFFLRKMLDRDIRDYLHKHYLCEYTRSDVTARVIDEMGLSAHAARIDIGVINGKLVGYEIKSDRDNLDRLPHQLEIYNQIFDLVTIVCGPKHEAKLLAFLPTHCGLFVTHKDGADAPFLRTVRMPSQNAGRNGYMIASLLWHEEAKALLIRVGIIKGLSKLRRWELWERLAKYFEADVDKLAEEVRGILKNRQT